MSQSITITGTYRNNKTRSVGLHNPKNNRHFNGNEEKHLWTMVNEYIQPVRDKFKALSVSAYLQDGTRKEVATIGDALLLLEADPSL